ncbi:hypothetical protein D3C87_1449200 [compost metagenome]
MIHADVAVTGRGQLLDGALEHLQFLRRRRQFVAVDAPLGHEAFRQVRIVEHRQPVGLQRDDFVDRVRESVGRLFRQAVDQVNVDRAKLQGAGGVDHRAGLFQALQAIHRPLHRRIEVLQADADPIEAQFTEQAHGRPIGFARVDLDAIVAGIIVQQVEAFA